MLFDPNPKRRREDLFDFDEELMQFVDSVMKDKLTLVTGLRRYGKTSLILTGLNEARVRYVYVDCRLLPDNPTLMDFMELLVNSGLSSGWFRDLIRGLDFVEIGAFGVRIRVRKASNSILRLIESLGGIVLVFDEAQLLRNVKGFRLNRLLAYIYDNLDTRLVLSGSEVGLLYSFLGLHNPESPLFGRAYREVRLRPLDRVKAIEFLRLGFRQAGISISEDVLTRAVEELGGIIGWLTYFGHSYIRGMGDLEAIVDDAAKLAASEVNRLLNMYGIAKARYVAALNAIAASNGATWSEVRNFIMAKLGKIPDTALSNILRNLERLGIVAKNNDVYAITDPVIRKAILRGYVR